MTTDNRPKEHATRMDASGGAGASVDAMPLRQPDNPPFAAFTDPDAAVERLNEIFATNTAFLRDAFKDFVAGELPSCRVRACYPQIRIATATHSRVDSRLAYGFVSGPGVHSTTVTRPDLFAGYLREQIELLLRNHEVPVEIGVGDVP